MAFDLTGHDLLSEEAQELHNLVLAEHTAVASYLLGFAKHEASITKAELQDKAERALALQVSHQVVAGIEAGAFDQEQIDGLKRSYRDRVISPAAMLLAEQVLMGIGKLGMSLPDFAMVRSRR